MPAQHQRSQPNQRQDPTPWFRVYPPENKDHPQFHQNVGPNRMPPRNSSPLTYFMLIFSLDLMRRFVLETNRYARSFVRRNGNNLSHQSRVHEWIKRGKLTLKEFKAFLAVILNMGLIKKATISEYWNRKNQSQSTPWFRKVFTRNRFQLLLKFLHIVDNRKVANRNSPNYDPMAKFRPIVDHFNLRSKLHYTPDQNVSIDESLVGTKSRTVMRQYIPTKHSKFGVKLWMLTEAVTGYCYQFIVYRGKKYDPTPAGQTQGSFVVMSLLRAAELLNKWYHVFCDSFFTSITLANKLLTDHRTFLTGTIRSNRPLPNMIKNTILRASESVFARRLNILVCAFKEKEKRKSVKLVSTRYNAELTANRKPHVITEYNRYMGGVDLNDMLTSFYDDGRKSTKMWKKITFNIIHRMVINAFILYSQNTDNPKSRLHFIQALITELAADHLADRTENLGNENNEVFPNLRKLPAKKEKDCCVCSIRNVPGGRKRSKTVCVICGRGVHKLCYKKHAKRCRADE